MYTRTGEFPGLLKPAAQRPSRLMRFAPEVAIAVAIVMMLASAGWRGYTAWSEQRQSDRATPAVQTGIIASVDRRFSHNGRYSAEVAAAAPFVTAAAQSWTVHIESVDRQPLESARIFADVWMPDRLIHLSQRPAVRYLGNGNYRIDNFTFPNTGWWNVALVIDGRAGVDSVAFNLILPET